VNHINIHEIEPANNPHDLPMNKSYGIIQSKLKKSIFLLLLSISICLSAPAQIRYLDSLEWQLKNAGNEDTFRVWALSKIADYYGFVQADSGLLYATQVLRLSDKLKFPFGRYLGYRSMFFAFNCQGNYPKALEAALNIKKIIEDSKVARARVTVPYYFLGLLNLEMRDFPKARELFYMAMFSQQQVGLRQQEIYFVFSQMANLYNIIGQSDSAMWYANRGFELGLNAKEDVQRFFALACGAMGSVYQKLQNYKQAEYYFRRGIAQSKKYNNIYFLARNYNNLAILFAKMNVRDSAMHYAKVSLQLCLDHNYGEYTLDASRILTNLYETENNSDSTLKYMKIMVAAKDSVFNQSKGRQFQEFAFNEISRQQEISATEERARNKARTYTLVIALSIFLLIAFLLYRNNRQKQKDKIKIEKAYEELKLTQAQLIQREKMASLGELTAGIAHEIQNPLNFVNNFSEINTELLDEVEQELNNGNLENYRSVLKEVRENELKINQHGKRADAIIKGMLQHSRSNTGQKELTQVNVLAEEYLRLSYHGFRAKENSFNAIIHTEYDKQISSIRVVPSDLGRVLLNIFNNSFYAMNEKRKQHPIDYHPEISVITKTSDHKIEIRIKDNGIGIQRNLLDKIYQPFFTTKPTGQGTGLGLSLSYDIIKAHAGEISVHSVENEYSEFIIILPA
jgi:two-component system NtrC family sensor kinase